MGDPSWSSYLMELARYIVLNPVRAQMVRAAIDWRWSSYRATVGTVACPQWLDREWLLSSFAKRQSTAINRFMKFVAEGKSQPSPWDNLKNQIFLGDDQFVDRMLSYVEENKSLSEIPKVQKRKQLKPLADYFLNTSSRNEAIVNAYQSGNFTLATIGDHCGLHYSTVGGIVKKFS